MKSAGPPTWRAMWARHQLFFVPGPRQRTCRRPLRNSRPLPTTIRRYTIAQYQLAEPVCKRIGTDLGPIAGDRADGYHSRAITALERIPELVAGAEPMTCQMFMMARLKLLQEWFQSQKIQGNASAFVQAAAAGRHLEVQ